MSWGWGAFLPGTCLCTCLTPLLSCRQGCRGNAVGEPGQVWWGKLPRVPVPMQNSVCAQRPTCRPLVSSRVTQAVLSEYQDISCSNSEVSDLPQRARLDIFSSAWAAAATPPATTA